MSDPNVSPGDMPTPPLDPDTADRLLAGSIQPDDAPNGYGRVAALVAAAREPATTAENVMPPACLAEVITSAPHAVEPGRRSRRRFATAAVAATVLLSASGAAAATNNLPAPIQRTVASLGSHVGLSIPEPAEPGEPAPGSTDPDSGVGVEGPSVPDPEDVVDGTPDLDEQLPVDPRPEIVDELIPEPPVTLTTPPVPVNPPATGQPCAPGEALTAENCVPADQPDTPADQELEVPPTPDADLPGDHDIPGPAD